MAKLMRGLGSRGGKAIRQAARKVTTRILAAEGRRSFKRKMERAGQVSRKAAKAGLIAGTLVAAGVVRREIRKRRGRG